MEEGFRRNRFRNVNKINNQRGDIPPVTNDDDLTVRELVALTEDYVRDRLQFLFEIKGNITRQSTRRDIHAPFLITTSEIETKDGMWKGESLVNWYGVGHSIVQRRTRSTSWRQGR